MGNNNKKKKAKKKKIGRPQVNEKSFGGPSGGGKFNLHLFNKGKKNNKHVGQLIVSMFLQFDFEGFENITKEQKQSYVREVKRNIRHKFQKNKWKLIPHGKTKNAPYDEIRVDFAILAAIEGWHWDDFEITIHNGSGRAYVNGIGNMHLYAGDDDHKIVGGRCVAAHEFGHCLGLEDEYIESHQKIDTDATWWRIFHCFIHGAPYRYDENSMMRSNREVRLRHYWQFARWVKKKLNVPYAVTDGKRTFFVRDELWKPIKNESGVKGPGGFGKYGLFFFPIGNDEFQQVLQQRYSNALGRKVNIIFDSLLVVRLNLQLYFANWMGRRIGWSDDEKRQFTRKIVGWKYDIPPIVGLIDKYWNNRFYLTAKKGRYKKTAVLFDVRTLMDVESWVGQDRSAKDAESWNWSDDFEIEFWKNTTDGATNYTGGGIDWDIILPADCIDPSFKGYKLWHHFGHLLGLLDENDAGHKTPYSKNYLKEKDSIMHSGNEVKWRHYWPFAQWLHRQTGVWYKVSDGSKEYDKAKS
jgi:hypothetical protein